MSRSAAECFFTVDAGGWLSGDRLTLVGSRLRALLLLQNVAVEHSWRGARQSQTLRIRFHGKRDRNLANSKELALRPPFPSRRV